MIKLFHFGSHITDTVPFVAAIFGWIRGWRCILGSGHRVIFIQELDCLFIQMV